MENLQVKPKTVIAKQVSIEQKWLVLVVVSGLVLILGIKIGVYSFLNAVPEGFFKSAPAIRGAGTPDRILSPERSASDRYQWQTLPEEIPVPLDNPMTPAKIELGKKLFFDKNLSADRSLSCASCHALEAKAGADGAAVSTGIYGQMGDRNAPTVWNTAFQKLLFWDGRAGSLEEQAIQPFLNPVEMGMPSVGSIEMRVREQPEYIEAFMRAYAGESDISIDKIVKAIASYERTLITRDTPYDAFVLGDRNALTPQQLNGMVLFADTGCIHCHFGPNFSAASVFNEGQGLRGFPANPERLSQQYAFIDKNTQSWRVPSLRNVALTGPWLHNGEIDNLHDVVKVMSKAQLAKSEKRMFFWNKKELDRLENPDLTEQQVDDIVAFLHSLSSQKLVKARTEAMATKVSIEHQ
ncbi:cytochrome-c peroxidase [Neptuniibacter caesariensis]|uniref:Methylamine utilization protein MauG n=1 Tax=Neptuniibacter caesariensis TaxID=207954 RepID=A0A7U8C6J3_NEPCE|nr:cytochrome c peroxidase [Neptuniibacter caesariensis]EAR62219.1 cytochrome C peroxidase [Oceanospirillum sp. MED92] [Neptuniibacter caesariensis]